uniref:RING-type domain-containing protein n=1 Tax=Mesocestoides corti TaxID=53468 RepID=A0A5K3FK63_MESCO
MPVIPNFVIILAFNVNIPAIMVGRSSGNTIRSQYLYLSGYLARMKPNPGTVIEYYLVPFLITLSLAFFGIIIFLAFRVFRTCLRQSKNRLSRDSLNKLPEIRYSEDYQNLYETCAICLEDYAMGDKLRVLPCHHAYHSKCVDRWLLRRQGSCPVCKYRINRNHDDVDTDADDNNVEEEDEESAQPSNSLVDRTGSETIEAPQPIDTASACETNTVRGDDDSAPLLSKSAPSASWLSGGQLPSNGTAWLGYDNPAVETVDEISEVKVDVHTRDLGSAHSSHETEEGEGQPQTLSPEEEGEHHKFLPTLDV